MNEQKNPGDTAVMVVALIVLAVLIGLIAARYLGCSQ